MMAEARERPRAGLLHPDAAADEKYDVGLPGTVVEEEYEDDNGRVLTEEPDGYRWCVRNVVTGDGFWSPTAQIAGLQGAVHKSISPDRTEK